MLFKRATYASCGHALLTFSKQVPLLAQLSCDPSTTFNLSPFGCYGNGTLSRGLGWLLLLLSLLCFLAWQSVHGSLCNFVSKFRFVNIVEERKFSCHFDWTFLNRMERSYSWKRKIKVLDVPLCTATKKYRL